MIIKFDNIRKIICIVILLFGFISYYYYIYSLSTTAFLILLIITLFGVGISGLINKNIIYKITYGILGILYILIPIYTFFIKNGTDIMELFFASFFGIAVLFFLFILISSFISDN